MADAKTFNVGLKKFAGDAKKQGERYTKAIIIGLYRDCILRTPVDTGRARSNWMLSINSPLRGVTETKDSEAQKGSHSGRSHAMSSVADAKLKQGLEDASMVYITNSVPYIGRLDEGHSAQNTKGIIKPAIEKAKVRAQALETSLLG